MIIARMATFLKQRVRCGQMMERRINGMALTGVPGYETARNTKSKDLSHSPFNFLEHAIFYPLHAMQLCLAAHHASDLLPKTESDHQRLLAALCSE